MSGSELVGMILLTIAVDMVIFTVGYVLGASNQNRKDG